MKKLLSILAFTILLAITPLVLTSCFSGAFSDTSTVASSTTVVSSQISEEDFQNDYNEIVDMLKKHNSNIEYCADVNILAMNFCINELSSISKFSTVHRVICLCDEEEDFERFYNDEADTARYIVSGVFKSVISSYPYPNDEAKWQATLSLCAKYNEYRLGASKFESEISDKLTSLRTKYSSTHSYEIGLLNEWFVESKVFSESISDFNKSKLQYQSDLNSFKTALSRLSTKADIY